MAITDLEIRSVETCWRFGRDVPVRELNGYDTGPVITIAGIVTLRQRPPTANGVVFITLEDETGFIQCIARPQIHERLDHVLRRSALIVRGTLSITGNWRGMVITDAWALDGIFGGTTQSAVRSFQRNHSLLADGIVGQQTWENLSGARQRGIDGTQQRQRSDSYFATAH